MLNEFHISFLLDRDVILVTIQYRLGALGFLDLGHEQIGGNQALWDQRLGEYNNRGKLA
jgi:carboxylesterase type B